MTVQIPTQRSTSQGGGYEWRADGQRVAVGAAALELSRDGTIPKFMNEPTGRKQS